MARTTAYSPYLNELKKIMAKKKKVKAAAILC